MNKSKVVAVNLFMVLWTSYGNGHVSKLIIICSIHYTCYLYRLHSVLPPIHKLSHTASTSPPTHWAVILCGLCLQSPELICDIPLTVRGWSVLDVWLIRLNYEHNLESRSRSIKCMLDFLDWFFSVIFWGRCHFKLGLFT